MALENSEIVRPLIVPEGHRENSQAFQRRESGPNHSSPDVMIEPNASTSISRPTYERWLMAAAGLLFLATAMAYAFYVVFSRSMSPDEGYLMITVQSFIEGNALYDTVFTHYGPFYYAYEWVVHGLLSVPLTHDATRMLCAFHWLTAAVLLGIAAGRMMKSNLAGLFVFALAVVHLTPLANEPGHPQELIAVLLGLAMLIATRDPQRASALGTLAVITALLTFTKINVGFFFGLALLLTMTLVGTDLRRFIILPEKIKASSRRLLQIAWSLNWVLRGGCAALPFLLMRTHLAAEWCRNYSVVVSSAIATTLLVANRSLPFLPAPSSLEEENLPREFGGSVPMRPRSAFAPVVVFFLAASALVCGITILTGTSVKGLVDGIFLTPLRMPGTALLPLPMASAALWNAGAALMMGLTVAVSAQRPRVVHLIKILKLAFGVAGAFCLLGEAKTQLGYLLPWIWLVLIPASGKSALPARERFPRTFLCMAAVWQSLQAYPIAGTQVTTATVLLVVAYTICLRDALKVPNRIGEWLVQLKPRTVLFGQTLAAIGLLCIFNNVWCKLPSVRAEYASLPSLDLPGSRYVHMDAETTEMYRALSRYLEAECDTFVTYPGINSLYFWTGKRPPTHLNSTGWGPLSHPQQEKILAALRQSRRPMLVIVAAAAQGWSNYVPPQISPLVRCFREDYREVKRLGRFIILVPK